MRNALSIPNNYLPAGFKSYPFKVVDFLKSWGMGFNIFRPFGAKKQIAVLKQEMDNSNDEIAKLKWELVQKNELVKNIAFHQSHTVRRPLANILGIIEIINHHKTAVTDQELQEMIHLLKISADDLDKAIKHNSAVGSL